MGERGTGEVCVEIILSDKVGSSEREYKFVRRQSFKLPPTNPYSHDVVPVDNAKLTVQISENGVPQEKGVIDDKRNDRKEGYVQSMINEFLSLIHIYYPKRCIIKVYFDGWNRKRFPKFIYAEICSWQI